MIDILMPYLLGSLLFNLSLFLLAYKLQSDRLTDISYALTFIAIVFTGFMFNDKSLYTLLLFLMIFIWGLRIGGFLLIRVIKAGKDVRFDEMRSDFWKFGRFWLLQGLTVWMLMIPSILAIYSGTNVPDLISYLSIVIFLAGLIFESIADYQKTIFNSNPSNKGKWIESGLWRYSRHPNYFGEILVWIGVYFYAVQSLDVPSSVISLVSPVFITVLLLLVSGIPILEKSADKRWGKDSKYKSYKKRTSLLILWPPKAS